MILIPNVIIFHIVTSKLGQCSSGKQNSNSNPVLLKFLRSRVINKITICYQFPLSFCMQSSICKSPSRKCVF